MSALGFVTGIVLAGCRSAPAEPDSPGAASVAAAAAEAVAPLVWDVPPTWSAVDVPRGSRQKAAYRTPKAGDAKAEAEVTVLFPGTGSAGDVEKAFATWAAEFESDTGEKAKRAPLEGGKLPAETIDAAGKFKIGVGPHAAAKKSPVSMMREHYRLVGAVVKTPDRGNWFFKMTGPEDAVASSRDAFLTMVRSAR